MIEEKSVCKGTYTNIFSYQALLIFLQDTYVTLIDNTDPRAPIKSKHYWIHALKTKATMMLNIDGGSELLSDTAIVQLFLFLDLDGLF